MLQEDIKSLQKDWQLILEVGDAFVEELYKNLFELDPDLKHLFKRSMRMQGKKVMSMFDTAISRLDQPLKLVEPLMAAGGRHAQYGVHTSHYQVMGEAFIKTLQGYIEDWSDKKYQAWQEAFAVMMMIMVESHRVSHRDTGPLAGSGM